MHQQHACHAHSATTLMAAVIAYLALHFANNALPMVFAHSATLVTSYQVQRAFIALTHV
jgi:hypothetical protein